MCRGNPTVKAFPGATQGSAFSTSSTGRSGDALVNLKIAKVLSTCVTYHVLISASNHQAFVPALSLGRLLELLDAHHV